MVLENEVEMSNPVECLKRSLHQHTSGTVFRVVLGHRDEEHAFDRAARFAARRGPNLELLRAAGRRYRFPDSANVLVFAARARRRLPSASIISKPRSRLSEARAICCVSCRSDSYKSSRGAETRFELLELLDPVVEHTMLVHLFFERDELDAGLFGLVFRRQSRRVRETQKTASSCRRISPALNFGGHRETDLGDPTPSHDAELTLRSECERWRKTLDTSDPNAHREQANDAAERLEAPLRERTR